MGVGRDLAEVPFGQMVLSLAMAIADGQRALDKTSVDTARLLATEKVKLIEEISEVIEPRTPPYTYQAPDGSTVTVTGAKVTFSHSDPTDYTLMQAGLFPTFYQFTESIIEVKMAISSKSTSGSELEAGASVQGGFGPVSFAAHVNFKTSSTYSYSVDGSSLLRTTLKPVPPPARLHPRVITVNMLASPPAVTVA